MALRLDEIAEASPADFDAFYATFEPRVRALIRRKVRNRHRVDDLVQDTFVRAFRSHDTFDATRPAWPWLATIANNVVIDFSRRKSTGAEISAEVHQLDRPAGGSDPAEHFHRAQQRATISDALAALPATQRRVLLLREVDELRYDAVAQRVGVSTDSVKSTLKRARINFRQTYGALAHERGLLAGLLLPVRYLRSRIQLAISRAAQSVGSLADGAVLPVAAAVASVALGAAAVGGLVAAQQRVHGSSASGTQIAAGSANTAAAAAIGAARSTAAVQPPTAAPRAAVGNAVLGNSGSTNRLEVGDNLSHTFTYRVEIGGKYVQLRGVTYTQCHTNVVHELACDLLKLIPGTIAVGEPQPTPAPPTGPPPVPTHPLPPPL